MVYKILTRLDWIKMSATLFRFFTISQYNFYFDVHKSQVLPYSLLAPTIWKMKASVPQIRTALLNRSSRYCETRTTGVVPRAHLTARPADTKQSFGLPGKHWRAAVCIRPEWKHEQELKALKRKRSRWTSTACRGRRSRLGRRWWLRPTGRTRWATGKRGGIACSCLPSGTPAWCVAGPRTGRSTARCLWRPPAGERTQHSLQLQSAFDLANPSWFVSLPKSSRRSLCGSLMRIRNAFILTNQSLESRKPRWKNIKAHILV